MIEFTFMRRIRISRGGQIPLPAEIPRRWNTSRVVLEDLGDRIVVHPAPEDRSSVRGALAELSATDSAKLRARARDDELAAQGRRQRSG
jgi:tRNA threonylcarbamoyladenosine modification (KEOPS) complex  Pcc1 subunit